MARVLARELPARPGLTRPAGWQRSARLDAEPRQLSLEPRQDLARAVRRAVVENDDLDVARGLGARRPHRPLDLGRLVARRDQDRERGDVRRDGRGPPEEPKVPQEQPRHGPQGDQHGQGHRQDHDLDSLRGSETTSPCRAGSGCPLNQARTVADPIVDGTGRRGTLEQNGEGAEVTLDERGLQGVELAFEVTLELAVIAAGPARSLRNTRGGPNLTKTSGRGSSRNS